MYVLEPSVLDHVPAGQPSSFERNLFPSLLASGAPVYGYELHGYWRDLGTPIAYLAAQFDLLEGRLHLPINATERGRSQWFADDTRIAEGAVLRGPILVGQGATVEEEGRVFGPTVLGPGTVVAGGARLERSVLLEGARIERGAKVSDSIIGRGVVVGDGAVVRDGAMVGDKSRSRPATSWPAASGSPPTSGWPWARSASEGLSNNRHRAVRRHPSGMSSAPPLRLAGLVVAVASRERHDRYPQVPGRGAARR